MKGLIGALFHLSFEDIKSATIENTIIADATETLHYLTGDELIREQCFWREEELISKRNLTEAVEKQKIELVKKNAELTDKDA